MEPWTRYTRNVSWQCGLLTIGYRLHNKWARLNCTSFSVVTKDYPARSTYQVGKLPMGARIEVEAIAVCGNVETKYCNWLARLIYALVHVTDLFLLKSFANKITIFKSVHRPRLISISIRVGVVFALSKVALQKKQQLLTRKYFTLKRII